MKQILLFPFAVIWSLIIRVRNLLYDLQVLKSTSFSFPVIVVGNLSLGGTGKTQMMKWILSHFGHHSGVFILSRGYGRKSKGFLEVLPNKESSQFGDEPYMLKKIFPKIPAFVGENRVNAIKTIAQKIKNPIGLLDDAFQHRSLKPGLSILLFNYQEMNQLWMIPAGRLRDNLYRVKHADVVIVTKCNLSIDNDEKYKISKQLKTGTIPILFSGLKYGLPYAYGDENIKVSVENKSWIVFTGIAKPNDMINYLENHGKVLKHYKFKDHHNYFENELHEIKNYFDNIALSDLKIITTEKDAARLHETLAMKVLKDLPLFILPVEINFLKAEDNRLLIKTLEDYVKRNL